MSPKTAMAATSASASTSASSITATTTTNKRITTEMVKTANVPTEKSSTVTPMASSTKLASFTVTSSPSSLSSSSSSSSSLLPPLLSSPIAATTAFEPIPLALTQTKIDPYSMLSFASAASTSVSMARMSTMKEGMMSYHNVIAMLTLLFLFSGLAGVDGLKCYMCGQYNEGVGSITPCLNYSEQYAHLYLKDCSKSSEKYCVKYVSELSTVRDCATECAEKEVWETKTYCCNTDGCNGAGTLKASTTMLLLPVLYFIYRALKSMLKTQH